MQTLILFRFIECSVVQLNPVHLPEAWHVYTGALLSMNQQRTCQAFTLEGEPNRVQQVVLKQSIDIENLRKLE